MNANPPTEQEVRALRDNVYGTQPKFRTNEGWAATRENWMKPENVAWLRQQPQNKTCPLKSAP